MRSKTKAGRWSPLVALVLGLSWIGWIHTREAARLEAVSALPTWSVDAASADPDATTGYAGERRHQLVAGGNRESMEWIRTTQELRAGGPWRVRHTSWQNAPAGHAVDAPLLYRLWLAGVAGLSSGEGGRAVEVAARRADPWLHALLVMALGGLLWRAAGSTAAVVGIAGAVMAFPLAADFAAGAPHQGAMETVGVSVALAALLAGVSGATAARGWMIVAGATGGVVAWLAPELQAVLLAGVAVAGGLVGWRWRADGPTNWRWWSGAGAVVTLAGWAIESTPDFLPVDARSNLPLLALSWLAVGEGLQRCTGEPGRWRGARATLSGLFIAAVALSWPGWVWFQEGHGALGPTLADRWLTAAGSWQGAGLWDLGDAVPSILGWTVVGWALVVLVVARNVETVATRRALALGVGAGWAVMGMAMARPSWWPQASGLLVVVVAYASVGWGRLPSRALRLGLGSLVVGTLLMGAAKSWPKGLHDVANNLDEAEVLGSIERDLAYWLNVHTSPEQRTVLSSPQLAPALAFYGGSRGLGTLAAGNQAGDMASIRILSATSPAETEALLNARDVSHLVMTSWDPLLENYVRIGRRLPTDAPLPEDTFLHALQRWALPAWLQPVPYPLPAIGGMENERILVFRCSDEPSDAIGLARLAEYFLEAGDVDRAAALRERLRAQRTEPGALAALGQIELAVGDRAGLSQTLGDLQEAVVNGLFDYQPWDRRVSLVVLLTQVKLMVPAKAQLQACLADVDEAELRSLPAGALLKLLAMGRLHEVSWPDERLRVLAMRLLPPGYRARLGS